MKLLYCEHCHDVFVLSYKGLRSCECGRVKGRYINERDAEVSPEGVSLVISSKTLPQAINDMRRLQAETGNTAERNDYRQAHQGRIEEVWVRPNSGPGNPHTRLLANEAKPKCTRQRQFVTPANLLDGVEDEYTEQTDSSVMYWVVRMSNERKEVR